MSKFKVGDKVALNNSPNVLLGQIMCDVCEAFGGYYIQMEENYYAIMPEDELVLYDETALSDDEIYNMLKPKLDNSVFNGCIKFNLPVIMGFDGMEKVRCYRENEVIKAIALAYRSGYLRAKKGRPFKIGGEKD